MFKTTPLYRLCFSLFALWLSAPRSCCLFTGRAEAQEPREITAGAPAGAGLGYLFSPAVVVADLSPATPTPEPEIRAQPTPAPSPAQVAVPSESPQLSELRRLRSEQAHAYQELKLLRDERLRLIREDREQQPIAAPLVVMGVGFGMSAFSAGIAFLWGLSETTRGTMDDELKIVLIGAQVIGIPMGIAGLATVRYRLNHRENRPRIEELRLEERVRQRDLNEKKQRVLDAWSVVPELSHQEKRFGLSVRHVF